MTSAKYDQIKTIIEEDASRSPSDIAATLPYDLREYCVRQYVSALRDDIRRRARAAAEATAREAPRVRSVGLSAYDATQAAAAMHREWKARTAEEWKAICDESARIAAENEEKARAYRDRAVAAYRANVTREVLAELMHEVFPDGEGHDVTWWTATATQHTARAEFLEKMAGSTLRTAALHRAAAMLIADSGAETLGEVL